MATKKTALQVITDAYKLISSKSAWIKGVYAQTAGGRDANPVTTRSATCFCSAGAVYHAGKSWGGNEDPSVQTAERSLRQAIKELFPERSLYGGSPIPFNDHDATTHADVKKVFKRAIQIVKEAA
jgi:hypothetical protein